jgi:hypothetical protein
MMRTGILTVEILDGDTRVDKHIAQSEMRKDRMKSSAEF